MTEEHPQPPPARALAGGVLMGLANLVPGVSGGTMILALGLYDAFIEAVAKLTSFRWSVRTFLFLGTLGVGLVLAVVGLAGVAVALISEHRWIMYSLFIGMTLGGVPELVRQSRPFLGATLVSTLVGIALMAGLFFALSESSVPQTWATFGAIGALAASSMILPGVSGSYVLLIFGMYDVVIGSLSVSALREDLAGSIAIILPVGVGAVLGIAVLSNVLKFALTRWRRASHGLLLGLLFGSVLGLFPFQQAVHPELVERDRRKAIVMLVEGESTEAILEKRDVVFSPTEEAEYRAKYTGLDAGDVKRMSLELDRFDPTPQQIVASLGLLLGGFILTRLLGYRGRAEE